MPLLCPFECDVVFKTQTDQRQHLMKEHLCTDKEKNDFFDEREAEEKNNIRKTYLSNTQGLTLYKFIKLLRENNLHEVLVCGNGYCFLSCIILTLAEHGINVKPKLETCPVLKLGCPNLKFQVWAPVLKLGSPNLKPNFLPSFKTGQPKLETRIFFNF